ncbi:MAG: biotin carboxylase [Actinobacteria bacterium]|nr:biotin carboxylase [Actinomycetota bacterium]
MLHGLSEIYRFFRENTTPIYFVSPTAYNILGLDDWVSALRYVCYFDSFDGAHDHVFVPTHAGPREFETFESVNTYLLGHKDVIDSIQTRGPGYVLFVMFDEETERLADQLGLTIALPPRELRERIDSKIETTRLGNEAGVPSAPNVTARCDSYAALMAVAHDAGLGHDLVVQLPYGDSGRTTFFIHGEEAWDRHADSIVGEDLKIMKHIRHLPGTVEAVATRHGTLVGPVQVDLTGFEELTPYKGGWCGNDCAPISFGAHNQSRIREMARKLGDRLYEEGYKGVFCMDYLIDLDDDMVYLGEINPRISGASPLTNLITSRYGGVPLFLFHLLEFMDVDWTCDLVAVQDRWRDFDRWSQLVLKQTTDEVEVITQAPASGLWRMDDEGNIRFVRMETDWHNVTGTDEAFYLRVYGVNEYRYPGADLGVVLVRDRMQTADRELVPKAAAWAKGLMSQFAGVPVGAEVVAQPEDLLYGKWL